MSGIARQSRDHAGGLARPGARLRFAAALFLALGGLFAAASQVQAAVATRFSQEQGYGRLVFAWPDGVPAHSESITAGVLVVTFARPFAVDPGEFVRKMPDYVAMARQEADGKTLRLALKADYWLNARAAENALYVDLIPSSWTGDPPPLPADVLARLAAAAETRKAAEAEARKAQELGITEPDAPRPGLVVRVGRHGGFTRFVFDWNQPVLYSLVQQEGSATVTFDRTAKVSLAAIRANPPPFVSTVTALERNGRLSVFLKLKPGVTISDFREDLGIVLDLKPAQAQASDAAPAAAEAPPASAPATQEAHGPQSILPSATVSAPAPQPQLQPQPDLATSGAATADASPGASAAPQDASQDAPQDASQDAPLAVTGRIVNGRVDLRFPWKEPVGAAIFTRAGRLWIVFDRHAPLDLSDITPDILARLGIQQAELRPVELAGGVALTFPVRRKLLAAASEDVTVWRLSLGDALASTGRPVSFARSWRDTGEGVVTLDLKGARRVMAIHDPLVRDVLMVATARGPVQSVQASRSFIEFQALETVQGVAIVPVADDVNVAAAPDAVVVTRRDGLTLSAGDDGAVAGPAGSAASIPASPAYLDLAAWRQGADFTEGRKLHLKRMITPASGNAASARLDYARFLLGWGLGPEAMSELHRAESADPKLDTQPFFRALRGVAAVLSHRNPAAVADLSISALAIDPYAAAWRGLARAELGQAALARKDFELAKPVIASFDPAFQARVYIKAAQAALDDDAPSLAQSYLSRLSPGIADPRLLAEADFLRGALSERMNQSDEAVLAYGRAAATEFRPVAIRARYAKALLLNRLGKLTDAALAEEIDRLRMAWRGDELELRMLSKLAELRLAQGDIAEALTVMNVATVNFPDSDEAHAIGARMPDIFADYFLDGHAGKLQPVQALAFYYNFQSLTPIGQKGDEMIRHLAERLIAVDLLPQAETLLAYQIEQRLHGGVAAAQVGARLAGVYLLDQKPQQALRTIRATAQNLLPEDLADRRRLIEARALSELRKYDLALDLLSEMTDPLAAELKAKVLWDAQRWEEAGAAAETLLAGIAVSGLPLGKEQRFRIMRCAIAYSMANDEEGLARLRERFGERMRQSPDAGSFAILADPIEKQGVAFRELASRIAAADTMERFIASLKDEAAAEAPPAIN